jgi:hypothetical protein
MFVEVVAVSTGVQFWDVMEHFQNVELCEARWKDLWCLVDACRRLSFGTALADAVVFEELDEGSLIFRCSVTDYYIWDCRGADAPILTSEWTLQWIRPCLCLTDGWHGYGSNATDACKRTFAALMLVVEVALRGNSRLAPFAQRLHALRHVVQFSAQCSSLVAWNSWVEQRAAALTDAPLHLAPHVDPEFQEGSPTPTEDPSSASSTAE